MKRNTHPISHKYLVCSLGLPLAALALAGCGGGNSTTTTQTGNGDANTALRTATLRTIHSINATGSALSLLFQAPSRAVQTDRAHPLSLFPSKPVGLPTRLVQLTYIPALNLYDSTTRNGQTFSYSFFSDAAGTQPAGSATLTIPTTTSTYPYTTAVQFAITGGNYPGSGTGSLTYTSSSTIDIRGKLHLNADSSDAELTLNQSDDATGKPVFTGSASIVSGSANVQITDFRSASDTSPGATLLGATMTVPSVAYSGTFAVSATTLTITLTSGTKTFKATMVANDADGNPIQNPTLTLTYPDGTQQTIPNALTTPIK